MSQLLGGLLSFTGFALFVLAGVIWLGVRPHARAPRRWLLAVVLLYSAASLRIVPWLLAWPLVYGFHHFSSSDVTPDMTAVVVLGAGNFTVHGAEQSMGVLNLPGAARVLEAARVYALLGSPWMISSGGPADGERTEPSAVTMRAALVQLGVPAERIVLERSSRTTREEAVLLAPMLRTLRVSRIVLVTSDLHMRRSLAAFRSVGFDAVPAIAKDPLSDDSRVPAFLPTTEGLRFTSSVAHEYVGLAYYAARGWFRSSS